MKTFWRYTKPQSLPLNRNISRSNRAAVMDERTLEALKGSIAKWQAIVDGVGRDLGGDNCPLCQIHDAECNGCPVAEKVGDTHCNGTPYYSFQNARKETNSNGTGYLHTQSSRRAAEAELRFLKSLLPE